MKLLPARLTLAAASLLALVPPNSARATDANYFGVCDQPVRYVDHLTNVDEVIASGVKWVRKFPEWG